MQENLGPFLTPLIRQHACGEGRCRAEPPVREHDERLRVATEDDLSRAIPGHLHVLLLGGCNDKIGTRDRHTIDGEAKADGQWRRLWWQHNVPPAWSMRV